jgi:hypothetical protein
MWARYSGPNVVFPKFSFLTHGDLAAALERVADEISLLNGRGERFYIKRHSLERNTRELALHAAELDPERRRRSFQTGMIAAKGRMIPVRVRRSRRASEAFSRAFRV